MNNSYGIKTKMINIMEEIEEREKYIESLEDEIKLIIRKCATVYIGEDNLSGVGKNILKDLIEEYKEDI